jgi:hypothetical protein
MARNGTLPFLFPMRGGLAPLAIAVLSVGCVAYLYLWSSIATKMAGEDGNQHSDGVATRLQVDIAIVGAGLAGEISPTRGPPANSIADSRSFSPTGLSASIEAASLNPSAKILVIEREAKVGGNSAKASSGINAAVSSDDAPVFEQDTLKSGGGLANEHLVDVLVKQVRRSIAYPFLSDVVMAADV